MTNPDLAALEAEIERLTEREAQAKLDGVRAGIEVSARKATGFLVGDPVNGIPLRNPMSHEISDAIRTLDAEAIAKGIITADALSDLIAGDADLIVPHTLADSDGDDGA